MTECRFPTINNMEPNINTKKTSVNSTGLLGRKDSTVR